METAVNMHYLKLRLLDSGFLCEEEAFNREKLIGPFDVWFAAINYKQTKADFLPFIKDKSKLNLWNAAFFTDISMVLRTI